MNRAWCHYAVGGVVQKLSGLVMIPVTAHYLGANGYGQLALLVAVANLGSIVASLGLPDCMQRYAYDRAMRQRAAVLGARWALLLLLLSPVLAMALSALMPGDLHWSWLQMLLVNLALGSLLGLRLVSLRIGDRSGRYLVLVSAQALLQLGLTLLVLLSGLGPGGMMAAGMTATAMPLLLESGRLWARLSTRSLTHIRPVLIYALPIALSMCGAFALNGYERPWLAKILTLEQLGAFALAAQLSLLPAYAMEPFMLWWGPQRHRLARDHRWQALADWVVLAAVALTLMVCAAALLVPPLVRLALGSDFHPGLAYLPWLLAATLFRQLAALMNLGLYHRRDANLPMALNLLLLLPALLLIPLVIDQGGVEGLLWLLPSLMLVKFLLGLWGSQRLMPLPYAYSRLLLVLLPCLAGLVWHPSLLLASMLLSALILVRRTQAAMAIAPAGVVK